MKPCLFLAIAPREKVQFEHFFLLRLLKVIRSDCFEIAHAVRWHHAVGRRQGGFTVRRRRVLQVGMRRQLRVAHLTVSASRAGE